jgi:hypothetical protein
MRSIRTRSGWQGRPYNGKSRGARLDSVPSIHGSKGRSGYRLLLCAPGQEPEHDGYSAEEDGEGDIGDDVLVSGPE